VRGRLAVEGLGNAERTRGRAVKVAAHKPSVHIHTGLDAMGVHSSTKKPLMSAT
jgi:hypothetical protein